MKKWRKAFKRDENKLNSKILKLENMSSIKKKNSSKKNIPYNLIGNTFISQDSAHLKNVFGNGTYFKIQNKPRYSLKRGFEG